MNAVGSGVALDVVSGCSVDLAKGGRIQENVSSLG